MYYLFLFNLIFFIHNINYSYKSISSYESCIPIYLSKNLKGINEIYFNIKKFIKQQDYIKNNGTIHLVFTNKIPILKERFNSLNKYTKLKIRLHIFSDYFYYKINQMDRLSKVYWAHLLCFRTIFNAMENINLSHIQGGIIMESDVKMLPYSMKKILLNVKKINELCQKTCLNGWIYDAYNFFVHDPSIDQKLPWIKKLQGKIYNKKFETDHFYLKNNCMGIQFMIYNQKAFNYIYQYIRKKFIKYIKNSKYAIDNQITKACKKLDVKIFTSKNNLLYHNQKQGSTWLYNCTLSKKDGDFYCP